jgi:hypothetical protein
MMFLGKSTKNGYSQAQFILAFSQQILHRISV